MAENVLNIEIISPEGVILKDEINEIILSTVQGQIAVLPQHAPLFTKLTEGEAIIKKSSGDILIAIAGGFLEVLDNRVSILADYAVKPEEIQVDRVEEARKRAEEILKKKPAEAEAALARNELRKTLFALKIADKIRRRPR